MDSEKIGRFIARKRKQLGMTQQELADQLHVTNRAVSKWETGAGIPDISLLKSLAEALQTTVDDLLEGETSQINDNEEKRNLFSLTIDRKKYQQYLFGIFYQKRFIIDIIMILGSLMLTGGFALKCAYFLIGHYFNIIGFL